MLPLARSRRSALVTAALVTALAVSGCGADTAQDAAGDSPGTSQATATSTTDAATPTTDAATRITDPDDPSGDIPLIDGELAPDTALALSERLAEILASATDEFGNVGVDLLQLGPDYTSLYFVDPAEPETRHRTEHLDASWTTPLGTPRRGTQPPLPLDAIDPEVLRSVVEAAPVVLETGRSRLGHVSISPDETGEAEYLVALTFGTSLGSVSFDATGEVREVKPFT